MANVRVLSFEASAVELGAPRDAARLQRLALSLLDVSARIGLLRAQLAGASVVEVPRLRRELAELEDDWGCLASARAVAVDVTRAG